MAVINMQGTVRLKDINEDVVSLAVYWQDSDANIISDVVTSYNIFVSRLDAVTDALIEQTEIKMFPVLPSGLKSSAGLQPIASGELATYELFTEQLRSFGVYTPALNRAFIDLNGKVLATGANGTYLGSWLTAFGPVDTIVLTTNLWQALSRLHKLGLKSRKHRRQQDRVNLEVEP